LVHSRGNVQQLVSGRPRSTRPPIHGQDAEIVFLPIVSWQYVVNEPRPKRRRWSAALIGGLVGTFAFAGAIGAYIRLSDNDPSLIATGSLAARGQRA